MELHIQVWSLAVLGGFRYLNRIAAASSTQTFVLMFSIKWY